MVNKLNLYQHFKTYFVSNYKMYELYYDNFNNETNISKDVITKDSHLFLNGSLLKCIENSMSHKNNQEDNQQDNQEDIYDEDKFKGFEGGRYYILSTFIMGTFFYSFCINIICNKV